MHVQCTYIKIHINLTRRGGVTAIGDPIPFLACFSIIFNRNICILDYSSNFSLFQNYIK